jgi:hypothetical protein
MVLRDVLGILVGLGGIVQQILTVPPGELNEMALLILAIVAGVPGASQFASLIRNGTPTALPSLPSPPSEPLPDSPSSSQSV